MIWITCFAALVACGQPETAQAQPSPQDDVEARLDSATEEARRIVDILRADRPRGANGDGATQGDTGDETRCDGEPKADPLAP